MSPRPGTITEILDVDLPEPRVAAVRGMPGFVALQQSLWSRLEAQWRQAEEVEASAAVAAGHRVPMFGPG
jgi:hypothetical protein